MDLTLLAAPACPYAAVVERRLAATPARSPHAVARAARSPVSKRPPGPVPVHRLIASRVPLPSCRRRRIRWPGFLPGVFAARVITAHGRQPPPDEGGNDR